jgi:hypothetical protein
VLLLLLLDARRELGFALDRSRAKEFALARWLVAVGTQIGIVGFDGQVDLEALRFYGRRSTPRRCSAARPPCP